MTHVKMEEIAPTQVRATTVHVPPAMPAKTAPKVSIIKSIRT